MIHELGHLAAASFNVYCFEYAIRMGPIYLAERKAEKLNSHFGQFLSRICIDVW